MSSIHLVEDLDIRCRHFVQSTSLEALSTAICLAAQRRPKGTTISTDEGGELADRYPLAIASLLTRSWSERRNLTTETIQGPDCHTESAPVLKHHGVFGLSPLKCDAEECSLVKALCSKPESLTKMADAIPKSSIRREDVQRRQVLRDLVRSKHFQLTPERRRALGDAISAFFAHSDCDLLTTNTKDFGPLAAALGKNHRKSLVFHVPPLGSPRPSRLRSASRTLL